FTTVSSEAIQCQLETLCWPLKVGESVKLPAPRLDHVRYISPAFSPTRYITPLPSSDQDLISLPPRCSGAQSQSLFDSPGRLQLSCKVRAVGIPRSAGTFSYSRSRPKRELSG